jgi:hypothetical protein
MKNLFVTAAGAIILIAVLNACKHDIPKNTYCFEREILPLIKSNCTQSGCHNSYDSAGGGYVLDGYSSIMKLGIVPGNADASLIYTSLLSSAPHPMAPAPYPLLDDKCREMIKTWINEGAMNTAGCTADCNSGSYTFSKNVMPLIKVNCYGCHNAVAAPDFGGGIELSDYSTIKDQSVSGDLIKSIEHDPSVFSGMPKGLAQLTDCQISIIKKWVADGAPNN